MRTECKKLCLRFARTRTACHHLWRESGGGLSAVGLWPIPRKFYFRQLPGDSHTAAVAPSPRKSPQPGKSLLAQSRLHLARTRFFHELRCLADEHLLLPRGDQPSGALPAVGNRGGGYSAVRVSA